MNLTAPRWLQRTDPNHIAPEPGGRYRLPGHWVGAVAMLVAPALLLIGTFLRIDYNFFFTDQIRGYAESPVRMNVSYNCWLAGTVLLWPAVLALANRVGRTRPGWATWGAVLVILGLFARTYHSGVNYLAFQLVDLQGAVAATDFINAVYRDTSFQAVHYLSFAIMFGWYVLAIAAYLSRSLGAVRSIGLAAMSLLPLGILKGTETMTVIGVVGLCVALLPTGMEQLRDAIRNTRKPSRRQFWLGLLAAVAVLGLAVSGNYG